MKTMKTLAEFQQEYAIIVNGEIETMTLDYFLSNYVIDEVATPQGICDKLHIRYVMSDGSVQIDYPSDGKFTKCEVWEYRLNGRDVMLAENLTYEEAEAFILNEKWVKYKNGDKSSNDYDFAGTVEECVQVLKERQA